MNKEVKLNDESVSSNGIIASASDSVNAVSNSVEENGLELTSTKDNSIVIENAFELDNTATKSDATLLDDFVADSSATTSTAKDVVEDDVNDSDMKLSNVDVNYSPAARSLAVYGANVAPVANAAFTLSQAPASSSEQTTGVADDGITFVIAEGDTVTLDEDNAGNASVTTYKNIIVNGTLILNVSGETSNATISGSGEIIVNADETLNGSFVDFSGTFNVAEGVTLYLDKAKLPEGTIYVAGDGTIDLVSTDIYEVTHTIFKHSPEHPDDEINLYLRGHYAVVEGGSFNDIIGGSAHLLDTSPDKPEVALTVKNATVDGYLLGGRFFTSYELVTPTNLLGVEVIDSVLGDNCRLYAAGVYLGGGSEAIAHEVNLIISGSTTTNISKYGEAGANIYGGGYVAGKGEVYYSTLNIGASINVVIDATGTFGEVFAGGAISGYDANGNFDLTQSINCQLNIAGDINLTISDGTYYNIVGTGVKAAAGICSIKNTNLNISGGEFHYVVFCGAYSQGAYVDMNGLATTNITGGTFHSNVFGGGVSSKMDYYATSYLQLTGKSNMKIDTSGDNVVTFNLHVVAGTGGINSVSGGTNMTFTGLGENLNFGVRSVVWGGSSQRDTSGYDITATLELEFQDFHGEFTAGIEDFDTIKVDVESNVILTAGKRCNFANVDSWIFNDTHQHDAVDASSTIITWNDGSNDFTGDSIYIDLYHHTQGGFTLIDSNTLEAFQGFEAFGSVMFEFDNNSTNPVIAEYNAETGSWIGGGWELSIDEGNCDMVVSKIV